MLNRLCERATPITIHPDDSSCVLTTYLENIQLKAGTMLLDAPLPPYRQPLLEKRKLTLTTRYNGCLLTLIDIMMSPVQSSTGTLNFTASLPDKAYLLQRRRSYRAPVRALLDILAQLPFYDEMPVAGRLKDLSAGGCRIELLGDLRNDFGNLSESLPLSLSFPNGSRLNIDLSVVRVEFNSSRNRTYLGCSFTALTPAQEQQLNQVVTDLQRDYINHVRNQGNTAGTPALFVPAEHKVVAGDKLPAKEKNTTEKQPNQRSQQPTGQPAPTRQLADDIAPVDIKRAYQSGISAVKSLINCFRMDKSLPIEQARESAQHLLKALQQDRQGLVILSRQRDPQTYLLQHTISYTISIADIISAQYGEQIKEEMLERVILGGLCHNIAQAALPGGIQNYDLVVPEKTKPSLSANMARLIDQLGALPDITRETLYIVRDCHERLDGSGLPDGQKDQALNRVSKLAAVVYAHEKLSQCWHQCDWHYHPLRAFKQLIDMPNQFHQPSVRMLLKQQGKYPLGSTVQLNNHTLALVMRQDDQKQPSHLRTIYNLKFNSLIPPRDLILADETSLEIECPANPLRYEISSQLLKLPLRA